ncbi:hypothetical protein Cgig2_022829 [Carnegiea gigantea]|uniref:Chlororespiratory reduction 4 n=1 Tax=Carnegiea gigantea TaxID=171969 RepID=A0A9Q1KQ80_9CARY|nr:hypothetical protein Cgig2_022829 [Carnegiea gigantea]
MNWTSAVKSALNHKPALKPSINLSILETLLSKCRDLKHFNQILSQVITASLIRDTYAASRILEFATGASFVTLDSSRKIFNQIKDSNGFIWNTMMKAYLLRNSSKNVMGLYKTMLSCTISPDNYTYPILLQGCTLRFSAIEGRQIHDHVFKMGFDCDVYVRNTMVNMYAVCDGVSSARHVFDESPVLDSVSWNTILAAYVQRGDLVEANEIYNLMAEKNVIASNSMIVLLGKLGHVTEARDLFDAMPERDMVSWSALISSYEQNELYTEALAVFKEMVANGTVIDEVVLVSVLSVCAHLNEVDGGRLVHGLAVKTGIDSYVNLQNACIHMYARCGDIIAAEILFNTSYKLDQVSWNSMISGYMKCGLLDRARSLFDIIPEKDVVSWSSMISGYAQHNLFLETLAMFEEMQQEDVRPDETTLVSVVFHDMEEKGVSAWNAVIDGFAVNGLGERAIEMFSKMKRCGVIANEITFIGVLGACRHMGLVDEGQHYFYSMVKEHKLEPNVKHYGCMVDLLGRVGLLKEAEELIFNMPMEPDITTWSALLSACTKHGDREMGKRVGRRLIELQPNNDAFHVNLSNICAWKGDWDDVLEIRRQMMQHGVAKTPGRSSI